MCRSCRMGFCVEEEQNRGSLNYGTRCSCGGLDLDTGMGIAPDL